MAATSETEEYDTDKEKAIVCQVYNLVNAGNLAGLDAFISDDLVDHNAAPGQAPGLEGFRQSLNRLRTAFPDLNITVNDLVAEGDKVSDRLTIRGTQRGAFLGVPPSGRQVSFESMHIYRFDEGKIVEVWHIEDRLGLLQQLPAPTTAATGTAAATLPATASKVPTASATPTTPATAAATATATKVATTAPTAAATVAQSTTAFLGIEAAPIDNTGIRVVNVLTGSPAAAAKLLVGDVIVALDGTPLPNMVAPPAAPATVPAEGNPALVPAFFKAIAAHHPGDKITLTIQRSNSRMDVAVTLAALPAGFASPTP
jgi:steroid delta-isomerase-like uncharacterized protein